MEEERYPSLPWRGWKIVKRLGRGGYGCVYQAQRNSAGVMEDAAIKVISFPKDKEDIEADFTDGYDIVSVRNKYKDMLHRYVDEYQIMLDRVGCFYPDGTVDPVNYVDQTVCRKYSGRKGYKSRNGYLFGACTL